MSCFKPSKLRGAILLGFAVTLGAQPADTLIVPGVRVGPVTRSSTEQSLRATLGADVVKQTIETGEGETEPGLVIFKSDPSRQLEIVWNHDTPPHPQLVFICRDSTKGFCRWRTFSGIGFGTTLKSLEMRNGRPFEMTGWGTDVGGNIVNWKGGKLQAVLNKPAAPLTLGIFPNLDKAGGYVPVVTNREFESVQGDKFIPSSDPVLQKLNPRIGSMTLVFPAR